MRFGPKILLPAIVLLAGIVATTGVILIRPTAEVVPRDDRAPLVQIVPATAEAQRLQVDARGSVEPGVEAELVSEAAGRVAWVSPSLDEGRFFVAGEVLARLDASDHEVAVERSRATVERARSQLSLARSTESRRRSLRGHGASSQAVLDEAESNARIAAANLREAEAALRQAELDLDRTEIRAPFSGRVHVKQVAPGQFLQRGVAVATIHAVDYAEVRLPVSTADLALLEIPQAMRSDQMGPEPPGPRVVLFGSFGGRGERWEGTIVRSEGAVDPKTRMVTVVARIGDPYALDRDGPVLPAGLFVRAEIDGRWMSDLIPVPRRALRGQDRVVVVDAENRARERVVDVIRADADTVWVRGGVAPGDRICTTPPGVFVDGMSVRVALAGSAGPA